MITFCVYIYRYTTYRYLYFILCVLFLISFYFCSSVSHVARQRKAEHTSVYDFEPIRLSLNLLLYLSTLLFCHFRENDSSRCPNHNNNN